MRGGESDAEGRGSRGVVATRADPRREADFYAPPARTRRLAPIDMCGARKPGSGERCMMNRGHEDEQHYDGGETRW